MSCSVCKSKWYICTAKVVDYMSIAAVHCWWLHKMLKRTWYRWAQKKCSFLGHHFSYRKECKRPFAVVFLCFKFDSVRYIVMCFKVNISYVRMCRNNWYVVRKSSILCLSSVHYTTRGFTICSSVPLLSKGNVNVRAWLLILRCNRDLRICVHILLLQVRKDANLYRQRTISVHNARSRGVFFCCVCINLKL